MYLFARIDWFVLVECNADPMAGGGGWAGLLMALTSGGKSLVHSLYHIYIDHFSFLLSASGFVECRCSIKSHLCNIRASRSPTKARYTFFQPTLSLSAFWLGPFSLWYYWEKFIPVGEGGRRITYFPNLWRQKRRLSRAIGPHLRFILCTMYPLPLFAYIWYNKVLLYMVILSLIVLCFYWTFYFN